jgi:hypothetical protein
MTAAAIGGFVTFALRNGGELLGLAKLGREGAPRSRFVIASASEAIRRFVS